MLVRAVRPFRGEEGFVHPKQQLDMRESRAKELIASGLVVAEIGAAAKPADASPENKMIESAPERSGPVPVTAGLPTPSRDPIAPPPTGSPTGGVRSELPSQPDQVPPPRGSRRRRGGRA